MDESIRVLIVDDHPVVRHGLRGMLSNVEGFEIVGDAENGAAALKQVVAARPHVVLLDVHMPGQDGIQVARQMKRIAPEVRIIMLTIVDDLEYVSRSLEVGADGYVLKRAGPTEIADAIRAVHQGRRVASQEITSNLLGEFAELARERTRNATGLLDVELRILEGLAEGKTYRELANRLFLSEITVRRRVQDIYNKLEASDRAEAVATAIRRGLI